MYEFNLGPDQILILCGAIIYPLFVFFKNNKKVALSFSIFVLVFSLYLYYFYYEELIDLIEDYYNKINPSASASISKSQKKNGIKQAKGLNIQEKKQYIKEKIGGLDNQIDEIIEKILYVRKDISINESKMLKELNIRKPKGLILYGPPGTGKTLIARVIGEILEADDIQIIKGPSLKGMYIGHSEKAIRDIFEVPLQELQRGIKNKLHLIIFDEFDAVCPSRGGAKNIFGNNMGSSDSYTDSMTTQLISILDSVDGYDISENCFIIATTNRIDTIDDAVIRNGRFDLKLEINLPDEVSREDIFKIHFKPLAKYIKDYTSDFCREFAHYTKGKTGAFIASLAEDLKITLYRNSQLSTNYLLQKDDILQKIKYKN